MNFVVANFLYHACPEIALILTESLMEDYELCSVYEDTLQGLHQHNQVLSELISKLKPSLFTHMTTAGILTPMFTTAWVLDLFSHIIPLDEYSNFLDNFFK